MVIQSCVVHTPFTVLPRRRSFTRATHSFFWRSPEVSYWIATRRRYRLRQGYCCILAKCYGVSSRFVDERPIFSVDPRKTGLTPVHFLRYFYYSGVVHVGTKRWKDAVDNFRMVISTPANTLSALVVEAYKKLVLVSLIFSGKLTPLPKYTSHVVSRQLKSHIKEYIMVDNKFQAGDVEKLKAAVTNGREIFIQDGNMGLVKQVTEALMKRKIMQLTHTYITLSLDDIATTVGLSNSRVAENYILRMVESGEICAKIEHPVGTVHFKEDHNEVTPDIMLARLEDNLSTTVQLTDRIRRLDMQISVSPQYIQKVAGDHSIQGPGLGPPGPSGWDEDIYSDI